MLAVYAEVVVVGLMTELAVRTSQSKLLHVMGTELTLGQEKLSSEAIQTVWSQLAEDQRDEEQRPARARDDPEQLRMQLHETHRVA